ANGQIFVRHCPVRFNIWNRMQHEASMFNRVRSLRLFDWRIAGRLTGSPDHLVSSRRAPDAIARAGATRLTWINLSKGSWNRFPRVASRYGRNPPAQNDLKPRLSLPAEAAPQALLRYFSTISVPHASRGASAV